LGAGELRAQRAGEKKAGVRGVLLVRRKRKPAREAGFFVVGDRVFVIADRERP